MDIYQEVTDKIVSALETGVAPWVKPWNSTSVSGPYNAASGREYSGINWLVLSCSAYASQGWLTFNQAKQLGGSVRKGEKGTHIVFWSFPKIKDKETGEEKVVPFAKGFTVFNVEQCDIDVAKLKKFQPAECGETSINDIARSVGAIVNYGGGKAFYNSSSDHIGMPSIADFKSADLHDATLAHELVHWTGHKARCDRQFGRRFGDDAYAFEELVAEIGSAFVCARMGVALESLQHAEYVGSWLRVLKGDKRAIFTASSQAKQAAEFLLAEREEEALDA